MADFNMFSDITSANIAEFWETLTNSEAPYLAETLFPTQKQTSSDVEFFRGITNAPKPLAPSSFDVQAIPRNRQGYEKVLDRTRFFKESKYIDEELRQQLLRVANSPVQSEKDIILNQIFNDSAELLRGAALTREIMRMQVLQTGKLAVSGNGQAYTADYGMKATHIANPANAWGTGDAVPADDFDKAIDIVGTDSGQTLTRAVMNRKTFNTLLSDNTVKSTLLANNANTAAVQVPRASLIGYLQDEFGITVQVYDKTYVDATGALVKFIPDGQVIFMPEGNLGTTRMSTTPEEADLLASAAAQVSIVDGGVAIKTITQADPVSVQTVVSQQVLPTFEQIDGVYVLNAFSPKA